MKVVIVPGNGAGDVEDCNWYPWLRRKLQENSVECLLRNMPDPVFARESIWIPFMENELHCDEATIIVGHSSGAQAAMRYMEKHKVRGVILVSACITDLGDPTEKASGYYDRPYLWDQMKANTQWIIQFGSSDDPFLPFAEQQQVAIGTGAEFHHYSDKGHFNMNSTFPELLKVIMEKIGKS